MRTARGSALLVAVAAVLAAAAAPAPAAASRPVRELCSPTATLRTTPGGYVVARLVRPQRLTLLGRDDRQWTYVRTRTGARRRGWILTHHLCPR